ncbi:MAG: phosphatidylglycerophosphatase A [Pseudomonadales bacterium]|jgi:phosphatidylglycerophosphatase A|nr:phosphatidylglycerophosphatase A [Pseudomonadales bacterium]MDP7596675.1 phosphatidylglycerophosphatase A [Pseudomonadales bacterium]HJN50952.1 phosphatidylglycerophosphatase A [Pseudomonadales bacterium]|tara:strand:- start:354 stop:860 length:507 start_codon:yes stop_codon:yes gene_type:complete
MQSELPPLSRKVWTRPDYLLAFGFGAGLSPKAPGTMGTLVGVLIYLLIRELALPLYLLFVAACFILAVYLCERVSKDMDEADPGGIVLDEMVGYWIVMIAAPAAWYWILIGFLLFRVADIYKPWPIVWLDKNVNGGLGIMLDDVAAAVMAWVCLNLINAGLMTWWSTG